MLPDLLPFLNLSMALFFGLGLFALQVLCLPGLILMWARLSAPQQDKIKDVLAFVLGPNTDPVETLALMIFVSLLIGFGLAYVGLTLPAILMVIGMFLAVPLFLYYRASSLRARELELALPLALQQIANEMAAGATLETALKKVAKSAPAPADVEIGRLQRRVEIMGIDEAFGEMAKQLNMQSFTLTAAVVRVGTSSGGRLIEALKNLSRTLIEIERLNKKLRTASENGRRNLYLMSFVGPLVAIGSAMAVDHEVSVLSDGLGQLLIMISMITFFAAHVLGHTMTKVQV